MPSHGYLVFLLRAAEHRRPRALYRLDEIGSDGNVDLLEALEKSLAELGSAYHSDESKSEGFRIRELKKHGRMLWLRINKGPEGSLGEAYHTETGNFFDTDEKVSLLSGLRAAIYVPKNSYYGLLFVERIGGRHLKELLKRQFIDEVGIKSATAIRVESFAEVSDWKRELDQLEVFRVSELLSASTTGSDASTPEDMVVKVAAEGAIVRRMGARFKEIIEGKLQRRDDELKLTSQIAPFESRRMVVSDHDKRTGEIVQRRKRASKDAFTVQDEEEYQRLLAQINAAKESPSRSDLNDHLQEVVPIDRSGLQSRRLEVGLGEKKAERTFVIESDSIPQFVYELGGRHTDNMLKDTWDVHAKTILHNRGLTIENDWLVPTRGIITTSVSEVLFTVKKSEAS